MGWNQIKENKATIEGLRKRVVELENPSEVIGEICCVENETKKLWVSITEEDIADKVNGYYKLKLAGHYYNVIGLKGEVNWGYHTCYRSIFWIKKSCILFHDKDMYVEDRKKIEKQAVKKLNQEK